MGKGSRDKGKVGEREVVQIARAHGFPRARRQGDAGQDDRDIAHVEPAYLEVRRREKLDIPGWCREVDAAAPDDLIPVVAFRRNGEPWRAILPLETALELLARERP
jgi:hypothetical protein